MTLGLLGFWGEIGAKYLNSFRLQGQRGIVHELQGDMSQSWMTWYRGPEIIPFRLQGPRSIPESGGLAFRARGGCGGSEKTAGPKTYCSLKSFPSIAHVNIGYYPPPVPLPDFDHLAAQQGRQRAARWLTGKAHLGQLRRGLPEPKALLLRASWYRGEAESARAVRGLCLWRNEQESKSQNKGVPVWLQEQC